MEIMECVRHHHLLVAEKGYEVVMTVLIGSQNYGLDTEESDIDTFTFVLPSFEDLAFAREPVSGEFEVEDGKCMYKDIRLALNLLKKTSPNSVECFTGKYRIFNPEYAYILEYFLCDEINIGKMVHCNHSHMLYAIAGMAFQLAKRNMPAGKRYSHALRLHSMIDTFTSSLDTKHLLELLPCDYDEAFAAKRDTSNEMDEYYNKRCEEIAEYLKNTLENFELTYYKEKIEKEGLALIKRLERVLMRHYIEKLGENNKDGD